MAIWTDLPAEIRQNILEYTLNNIKVKFTARHPGTRSTRISTQVMPDGDKGTNDLVTSLLLVSRHFVRYAELEELLLRTAIVVLNDLREVKSLQTRYTKLGLEMVQKLQSTPRADYQRRLSAIPIAAVAESRMRRLKQFVVDIRYIVPNECIIYLTANEAIKIARGYTLENVLSRRQQVDQLPYGWHTTALARKRLQHLVQRLMARSTQRGWDLPQLFNVRDGDSTYERVLECRVRCELPLGYIQQKVRFSTQNWCLEIRTETDSALIPQRIERPWAIGNDFTLLENNINAVPEDKYYEA